MAIAIMTAPLSEIALCSRLLWQLSSIPPDVYRELLTTERYVFVLARATVIREPRPLFRENLRCLLQLRLVSRRSRRIGRHQRHCGDAVVGGKPDDIGDALLTVLRERRTVGRIRDLMVAVNLAEEIVNDRLIRLQLCRFPACSHVGWDAGIQPALHGGRVMRVPDVVAAPIAR